jgi:hypothetical protein
MQGDGRRDARSQRVQCSVRAAWPATTE